MPVVPAFKRFVYRPLVSDSELCLLPARQWCEKSMDVLITSASPEQSVQSMRLMSGLSWTESSGEWSWSHFCLYWVTGRWREPEEDKGRSSPELTVMNDSENRCGFVQSELELFAHWPWICLNNSVCLGVSYETSV